MHQKKQVVEDVNEKIAADKIEEPVVQKPVLRETTSVKEDNVKKVAYVVQPSAQQKDYNAKNLKEYVSQLSCELNENWNPPKSGKNSQAIIIITIGKDGGFCKIIRG